MALATPWNKEMSNSINLAKQHSSCTLQVYVHPCIYSHKWCRPHEHQWRLIHILCRWVNCVTTDACADHHFEHPESIWSIISIRIGNWQGKWLCSPLQETQIKPHRSSQALRHCTSHKSCHTVHNYGLSPPPHDVPLHIFKNSTFVTKYFFCFYMTFCTHVQQDNIKSVQCITKKFWPELKQLINLI